MFSFIKALVNFESLSFISWNDCRNSEDLEYIWTSCKKKKAYLDLDLCFYFLFFVFQSFI